MRTTASSINRGQLLSSSMEYELDEPGSGAGGFGGGKKKKMQKSASQPEL